MRIPKFVPLVETERRKREITGLLIETVMGGYVAVVLCRIIFAAIIFPRIENLAYDEPVSPWAVNFVKMSGLDSRYLTFEWSSLALIFGIGSILGLLVGLTGKGFGHWISSLSRIQVNNPEDSLRVQRHWSYARKEGLFILLCTVVTGWVITKIDLGKVFDGEGVSAAGRLVLQLTCGIPGFGETGISVGGHQILNFHGSLFEVFQSLLNGVVYVTNAVRGLFHMPDLSPFELNCMPTEGKYYSDALSKLAETVYLAFMATLLAVPVAFVLAFFAARNLTRHSAILRFTYGLVRIYMNVSRSIEPIIWAILLSVWLGIGPFAGSIALMIHSVSSLVKQYSEAIESVDDGPIEAIQATGANRIATAWFAVVPQVVLPYLSFTIYRWDINVRMATIIGLVGGGGIGGLLIQEQGLAHWTQVGTIAFLIFIIVWCMDFFSARIREAIQ